MTAAAGLNGTLSPEKVTAASLNLSLHFMTFATLGPPRIHPTPPALEYLAREYLQQNVSMNALAARYMSNPRAVELGCRSPLRKIAFLLFGR